LNKKFIQPAVIRDIKEVVRKGKVYGKESSSDFTGEESVDPLLHRVSLQRARYLYDWGEFGGHSPQFPNSRTNSSRQANPEFGS
jgi:hypothetical protein